MDAVARTLVAVAASAALLAAGCGGGGSPSSSSYPAVQGNYGSLNSTSLTQGYVRQLWTAPDGTVTTETCTALTSIPTQNGAQFEGSVQRIEPCSSTGTFTGEVDHAGAMRFTLTQPRWNDCTAPGGIAYTGTVIRGELSATGHLTVQCDDGHAMTVEEQIVGSLPVPPTTN